MRGTVTGASLRFHAGDESVVVSNEEAVVPDRGFARRRG